MMQRRSLLSGTAVAVALSLAGCTGSDDPNGTDSAAAPSGGWDPSISAPWSDSIFNSEVFAGRPIANIMMYEQIWDRLSSGSEVYDEMHSRWEDLPYLDNPEELRYDLQHHPYDMVEPVGDVGTLTVGSFDVDAFVDYYLNERTADADVSEDTDYTIITDNTNERMVAVNSEQMIGSPFEGEYFELTQTGGETLLETNPAYDLSLAAVPETAISVDLHWPPEDDQLISTNISGTYVENDEPFQYTVSTFESEDDATEEALAERFGETGTTVDELEEAGIELEVRSRTGRIMGFQW